jgi:hypothetical protein
MPVENERGIVRAELGDADLEFAVPTATLGLAACGELPLLADRQYGGLPSVIR